MTGAATAKSPVTTTVARVKSREMTMAAKLLATTPAPAMVAGTTPVAPPAPGLAVRSALAGPRRRRHRRQLHDRRTCRRGDVEEADLELEHGARTFDEVELAG